MEETHGTEKFMDFFYFFHCNSNNPAFWEFIRVLRH